MDSAKFISFYNQIINPLTTVNEVLYEYYNFLVSQCDFVLNGYIAIVKGGAFEILNPSDIHNSNVSTYYPLRTDNVHIDLYSIEPLVVNKPTSRGNTRYYQCAPFLSLDSLTSFNNTFLEHTEDRHELIQLNFFHEGYLVSQIGCIITVDMYQDTSCLDWLLFLRNSAQASLTPLIANDSHSTLEQIFSTTENIISSKRYFNNDPSIFMSRLLDLAMEITDEADYGSALLYNKSYWNYVHAVGHDAKALSSLRLPNEVYELGSPLVDNYREVEPNVFLVNEILEAGLETFSEETYKVYQKIVKASKPIQQTIQLRIQFNENLKGTLSLDIRQGSPLSFSTKTYNILRRLHLLGQILFNYTSLNLYTKSFEGLTNLISTFIESSSSDKLDFLHDFLRFLIDNIEEADYASAFLRDEESITFLDAIGHDLEGLQKLPLKPEHFVSTENNIHSQDQIDAHLIEDLHSRARQTMPADIYEAYLGASLPIKDCLVSKASLDNNTYMNISIDIKKGSSQFFTKESIYSFKILSNLGFAFITNQYYINRYKTLNSQLEETIKQRTLELEESNSKLQQLVLRDSLTGLYNHKAIIEKLRELNTNQQALSVFLFDIDHFKAVNDQHGHLAGDQVLKGISDLLNTYKHIISGRYGGEEFMIIMPGYSYKDAMALSENIRITISNSSFIDSSKITISGGVVTRYHSNTNDLIKTVDTLLYKAKEDGRNRIYGDSD